MNFFYSFVIILLTQLPSLGQTQDIHERLYIHTSRQTILCGETLFFSAYNMSNQTGQLTDLSKILYIQLIGKDGSIIKQKIKLKNGLGNGDLFISSLIPSGNYYLVAHTRWMQNFKDRLTVPIKIINPFEEYTDPEKIKPDWTISFHTNHQKLIADINNEIDITVLDEYGLKPKFRGKIISDNNEKLVEFSSYKNGYAKTNFIPSANQRYKIIIEDQDDSFHFLELPTIDNVTPYIQIDESKSDILIHTKELRKYAWLNISSINRETLLDTLVIPQTIINLTKKRLKYDLLFFTLKDEKGNIISQNKHHIVNQPSFSNNSIQYEKRTNVSRSFKLPNGSYSVSVSKKYDNIPEEYTHITNSSLEFHSKKSDFLLSQIEPKTNTISSAKFLPEYHTELLSGIVKDDLGNPIKNSFVTISLLDKMQTNASITNENGEFLFNFEPSSTDTEAIFTELGQQSTNFSLEDKFSTQSPTFFPQLKLDSAQITEILGLNIFNQIENIYQTTDAILGKPARKHEQFEPYDFYYRLDDYNRFPEMKDYFKEYIFSIKVKKNGLKVYQKYSSSEDDTDPILLLDGVPVSSNVILNLNPYDIETVGIVGNKFFLGPLVSHGVLNLTSYDKNLTGLSSQSLGYTNNIKGVTPPKSYTFIKQNSPDNLKTPDKRTLLFWDPNLNSINDTIEVSFSTSDIAGNYKITIQGISHTGQPITHISTFQVE